MICNSLGIKVIERNAGSNPAPSGTLAQKRNAIVHGNLDVRTDRAEVSTFRQILERLAAEPVSV